MNKPETLFVDGKGVTFEDTLAKVEDAPCFLIGDRRAENSRVYLTLNQAEALFKRGLEMCEYVKNEKGTTNEGICSHNW